MQVYEAYRFILLGVVTDLPLPTEPQDAHGEPSDEIWSVYMKQANAYDTTLIETWLNDMDAILIFVRLHLNKLILRSG